MRYTLACLVVLACLARAQIKPVVFIQGNGNVSVLSNSEGVAGATGGVIVGGAAHQVTVNKHDQTMEMAEKFLQFCPAVEVTLDSNMPRDYAVLLNREGQPTAFGELGKSQIMVVNARKSPVFVAKTSTVKNAVKNACNAVLADWQAHGRIPQPASPASAPAPVSSSASNAELPLSPDKPIRDQQRTVIPPSADLSVTLRTTARADKYCKPETISAVLNDTMAYLAAKGLTTGPEGLTKNALVLVVDRPITKWLEVTVQGRDSVGNILWSEKVGDGGWGHLGTSGTLNTLDKVHKIIDRHLARSTENAAGD